MIQLMNYKFFFAIAAAKDWEIEQMDVQTIFFYWDLHEQIYVQQPKGFLNAIFLKYNCFFKKTLYNIKQ